MRREVGRVRLRRLCGQRERGKRNCENVVRWRLYETFPRQSTASLQIQELLICAVISVPRPADASSKLISPEPTNPATTMNPTVTMHSNRVINLAIYARVQQGQDVLVVGREGNLVPTGLEHGLGNGRLVCHPEVMPTNRMLQLGPTVNFRHMRRYPVLFDTIICAERVTAEELSWFVGVWSPYLRSSGTFNFQVPRLRVDGEMERWTDTALRCAEAAEELGFRVTHVLGLRLSGHFPLSPWDFLNWVTSIAETAHLLGHPRRSPFYMTTDHDNWVLDDTLYSHWSAPYDMFYRGVDEHRAIRVTLRR